MIRVVEKNILEALKTKRIIIITGPNDESKTLVVKNITAKLPRAAYFDASDPQIQEKFKNKNFLRELEQFKYLIINNAESLPSLNAFLKFIYQKTLITLLLVLNIRKNFDRTLSKDDYITFAVLPLAMSELYENAEAASKYLDKHTVYGFFSETINKNSPEDKRKALISVLDKILNPRILKLYNADKNLALLVLRSVAQYVGRNLPLKRIAESLKIEKHTLKKYLKMLEDLWLIFSLSSFFSKLSKEMSKASRYYFWDNGILNLLISNFNNLDNRDDADKIWENFCISERQKRNINLKFEVPNYFWSTYDKKEISYIEATNDFIFCYNFSWKNKNVRYPNLFLKTYQNSIFSIIDQDKYWSFIS